MLIFNISFYVNETSLISWKQWIDEVLFKGVDSRVSGLSVEVFEIVSARTEQDSIVFSVQWRCADIEQIQQLDDCVAGILPALKPKFGESVAHFSSIMKKL